MAISNPSFILQEMEIVLGIPKQDPTFFNLDFLTYTGIVPEEWELVAMPTRTPKMSMVSFQNDVSLTAEPQQTSFAERLGEKKMEDIEAPQVALRFLDIMKNINLTQFNLNFRGYVAFQNSPRAAHDYFFKTLFQAGAWQSVGTAPARAGLDLVYSFDEKILNFTVKESAIRRLDDSSMAALIFTGSFETDFSRQSAGMTVDLVKRSIGNWNNDLKQFIDVVSRFFRAVPQPTAPEPAPTTIPLN